MSERSVQVFSLVPYLYCLPDLIKASALSF
uniref:Uncharacterized protein n=1 Tax=Schistosoma japonicum TaxID=6182 RepID=Q5C1P6_SCHJA|nr:unknown [Schistosoma japonicum]